MVQFQFYSLLEPLAAVFQHLMEKKVDATKIWKSKEVNNIG